MEKGYKHCPDHSNKYLQGPPQLIFLQGIESLILEIITPFFWPIAAFPSRSSETSTGSHP